MSCVSAQLLADLQPLVTTLEDDLRERSREQPDVDEPLRSEWKAARDANRTAGAYEPWRDEQLTQVAVAWVLACVFVRFCEDNDLVETPWLSGPGPRRQRALDQHQHYFQQHLTDTDREYLHHVFEQMARLPGLGDLFDKRHNPLWRVGVSGDGATKLLAFWQRIDPATGALAHDFTDPSWDTRFLGDLYQDLSEAARERYALLQTPIFVEEFILDRTLEPAMQEFGYREVRLIDPTCGSGHFLLGAFDRILRRRQTDSPAGNQRDLIQKALDQVYGVDLNPFAVAIARFRLLLAALRGSGVGRLRDAPAFRLNLAVGDSLLHGRRFGRAWMNIQAKLDTRDDPLRHVYATEDAAELRRILGQQYHSVVGNPPYKVVRDKALNAAYRRAYPSCHGKYSMGVPFTERFFDLALKPDDTGRSGFVGLITTDAFMRREFGKKLIEKFLTTVDLTHIISTAGAYIPGHGTPTAILFGRNRAPVGGSVRAILGIRGEPGTPEDPSKGKVWTSMVRQVDTPGSEDEFNSCADLDRKKLAVHPWSIGGGGAAELKDVIDEVSAARLAESVESIGFLAITGEDEAFLLPQHVVQRLEVPARRFVPGDAIRDWVGATDGLSIFPYHDDDQLQVIDVNPGSPLDRFFWALRTSLRTRSMFGKTPEQHGLRWYEYLQFIRPRAAAKYLITYGEVASHNHFVLDHGGKVFNRTAPVIKLPPDASEETHVGLLGVLNSSIACFWLKQVCFPKGGDSVGQHGARVRKTLWDERYAFNASNLEDFPLASIAPLIFARALLALADTCSANTPEAVVARQIPSPSLLSDAHSQWHSARAKMIALQEELDWFCYRAYGVAKDDCSYPPDSVPSLALGERAFEIVLARRVAKGELDTVWFERHRSTPITEIPVDWPADYRRLVERRVALIESNRDLALLEQPEYKRRWSTEPWEERVQRALRDWLLDRLESPDYRRESAVTSAARLAAQAKQDASFMTVAELYRGHPDFDVFTLVAELVESESVPALPTTRYTASGQVKRRIWNETWSLQRREDAGEKPSIPVPPKYSKNDFAKQHWWRLRDKLDVPKERWISLPGAERSGDTSLPVVWAGFDYLQQAQAIAEHYVELKEQEGANAARLKSLLLALAELIPWLLQWHDAPDPSLGVGLGTYFQGFLEGELRALGITAEQLHDSETIATTTSRTRRKKTA